jgi:hypothetical protein
MDSLGFTPLPAIVDGIPVTLWLLGIQFGIPNFRIAGQSRF